jgi:hypothetical protein
MFLIRKGVPGFPEPPWRSHDHPNNDPNRHLHEALHAQQHRWSLPPGTYEVNTDEELLEGLSFPVYRRVATWIRLTSRQHGVTMFQTAPVDPAELETVLAGDAANPDSVD